MPNGHTVVEISETGLMTFFSKNGIKLRISIKVPYPNSVYKIISAEIFMY